MKQVFCQNDRCEYYDSDHEDNCSASELICNNCRVRNGRMKTTTNPLTPSAGADGARSKS